MNQIELIENYIEGKMTLAEKLEFENQVRSNTELRDAFLKVSSLIEGIEYVGRKDALGDLKRLEASLSASGANLESKQSKMQYFKYSVAAAVTVLLVVFGSLFVLNTGQTEPSKYFDNYFNPYMNNVNAITRSGAAEFSEKDLAFAAYDNYNFVEASKYFESLLSQGEDASLLLYSANTDLALGNSSSAIAKLSKLFKDYNEFDVQAAWYLSLANLKENNIEAAVSSLYYLMTRENSYSQKAINLFKSLNLAKLELSNGYPPEKAVVYDVRVDEVEAPDGSGLEEMSFEALAAYNASNTKKLIQWGVVVPSDGKPLIFINADPVNGLMPGMEVLIKRLDNPGVGQSAVLLGIL
jgi:hypothetical protein